MSWSRPFQIVESLADLLLPVPVASDNCLAVQSILFTTIINLNIVRELNDLKKKKNRQWFELFND